MKNLSLLLILAFAAGCSALNDMGSMKDTTNQMAATTSKMADSMCDTYGDLRQGNTLAARNEQNRDLIKSSSNEIDKLRYAAIYMKGFEFQFWKGRCKDTLARRDTLKDEAMFEFMMTAKGFTEDKKLKDLSPEDQKNLNSLAVTMDQVNSQQEDTVNEEGVPLISVLSLVEDSLKYRSAVNAGTVSLGSLPKYVQSVLKYGDTAIYILKLRQNYMAAIPLVETSNFNISGGIFPDLRGSVVKAFDLLFPSTSTIAEKDVATVEMYTEALKASLDTRTYLASIGINSEYYDALKTLYAHSKIPDVSRDVTLSDVQKKSVSEYQNAVSLIIQ